jgi:murein DD-endopeptidase MepM/ murein hydrolase activator NlpD
VPLGAVTGPIELTTAAGAHSVPSKPVLILPPLPPEPNPELSPVPGPRTSGAPSIETGTSRTKAFIDARPGVKFSFRLSGASAAALKVELVSAGDGAVVKTWTPQDVPGQVQSVSWNGRLGKASARPGRYSFRLTAASADGSEARSSQSGDVQRDAFDLYDHIFPIRGPHDFGSSGARFGAGRAGHIHQGQDTFAKCGTRMVAARGGRVKFKQYHAAAGNYIVIDGDGTDVDYVYMHLDQPSPFSAGDRVYTGQTIGAVGDTGNAEGCHLHFEMWGAPGWYDGGKPFDPLPSLQAWDSWS